jgi:putative Ig domain-containing protein
MWDWFPLTVLASMQGCGGGAASVSPPPPAGEVITITTNSNVQCVQTVPFTLTLQAQGNSSPLTWTILSGQLPAGLSLDSSSGAISGTPTSGPGAVTIQAADSKASASKQFFFTVWAKLTINPVNPPPAHLNAPYSLSVTGQGSSAIASWTLVGGQLPPGLSMNVSPQNLDVLIISGTPTQAGTFTFTIQAQDSTIPQTATATVIIIVDTDLTITKFTLKNGGQNQVYSDAFVAVNGTLPYHWSLSGTLPAGLSLDSTSGQVTGTPTDFGGFPYTASVSDSSSPAQTDSGQGLLNIAEQLQIVGALAPAYIGEPYNSAFAAIGGTYPYIWTLSSGSLPAGLALAPAGNIEGVPTQLGSSSFTLQVSDSGTPPYVLTKSGTLNVVPTPLNDLGGPLSPAPVNVIYHSQIPASGGTPPYSWSIASGQLPPGLVLNPATGYIDGTPTQLGTFNFVAQAVDSGVPPQTATANDFIQIRAGLGRNDSIATATPLGNSANQPIPIVLSISPYIDPVNAGSPNPDSDFYKLVANGSATVHVETAAQRSWGANTLDSVLELLDSTGNRLQTCTQPSYISACLNNNLDSTTVDSALDLKVPGPSTTQMTFYVHVLDWRGDARPDMQYYLSISGAVEPLTISPSTLGPGATRGVMYQQQFNVQGGTGTATWSVDAGSLPPGWSLNSSGLLSGTATTDGSYTFAIKATDSANPPQTARSQYTLQIAEPLVITSPATWPNACVNQPYSFTVTTAGGVAPIYFGFISSSWVAINLNTSTGVFSGTPIVTGTFTGGVSAGDSAQPPSGQSQTVTLSVVPCP